MLLYKYGKIPFVGKNYIILENAGNGYQINVANTSHFHSGQSVKLFIHEYLFDYQTRFYGFLSFRERLMFTDLIAINGIGPRIALTLLRDGYEALGNLIAFEKVQEISEFPYCTERLARNVVFELSKKWKTILAKDNLLVEKTAEVQSNTFSDLKKSLKILGYKNKQIDYALENVPEDDIEIMIQNAIKLLAENHEFRT